MRFLFLLLLTATIVVDSACERKGTTANAQSKPLEVSVAEVQQKDVPLYREWIGTVDGSVNAEIKAQVSGYLVKQEYTEGSSGGWHIRVLNQDKNGRHRSFVSKQEHFRAGLRRQESR
jgi:hypothetical protein